MSRSRKRKKKNKTKQIRQDSNPRGQTVHDISRMLALAVQHHQAGHRQQAESTYRQILRLDPEHPDALHLLGLLAGQAGRHDIAVQLIGKAIDNDSAVPHYHFNLGAVYDGAGNLQAAVACYREALRLQPDYPEAHLKAGVVLKRLNELEEAMVHLREVLRLDSLSADAHLQLGTILQALDRTDEASLHLEMALSLRPNWAEAHNYLGVNLKAKDRLGEAITHYREAIRRKPDYAQAHNNLGNALILRCELEEALKCFERATRLKPCYRHFIGLVLLAMGQLAKGWREHEYRWEVAEQGRKPDLPYPQWDGSPLTDRTILVYAEQGLGDEIMFASCLPDLIDQAGRCIIQCEPRLAPLFARSFPTATVRGASREDFSWLSEFPTIDACIPVGSLPLHFRSTRGSFPSAEGYLVPDPQKRKCWRNRLDTLGTGLKVGISWRSSVMGKYRGTHFSGLEQWAAVLGVPGVHFVNLQYDECSEEIKIFKEQFGVTVHTWEDIDLKSDLDDVAALTASLDLVITGATSVNAMAGALGVPTWLYLTTEKYWFLLGTDHFPWYPSVRIFPQATRGEWEPVFEAIARELHRLSQHGLTRQETTWKGAFGSLYTLRNTRSLDECEAYYVRTYGLARSDIIGELFQGIDNEIRILEVGCNIGCNLGFFIKAGYRDLWGLDVQEEAVAQARNLLPEAAFCNGSAFHLPFKDDTFDLVFTSGVLIHIAPGDLTRAMGEIVRCSNRYVWGFEYYAEECTEITYRGNQDLLWKANYPQIYLDHHPGLKVIRTVHIPYLDNNNVDVMFLLEKERG